MKRLLISTEQPEEKRIILLEDGLVTEYETELEGQVPKKGNIYKATVERVEPGLEAAFVDLPDDRNGFLAFKDISPDYLKEAPAGTPTAQRISKGDPLLVQIVKEKRDDKGAVLTTDISLPGCYLVLMPGQAKKNQVSRQADRETRQEMKDMLSQLSQGKDFGLVLRTSGLQCELEDLRWDLDSHLLKLWELIRVAYEKQPGNALIYSEHNLPMKIARDYFRRDVDEVICDTPSVYRELSGLISVTMPDMASRIRPHEENEPMVKLAVEEQIRAIHSRTLSLPSGGKIVFDTTEALVAVDVNSSRATKGAGIEETALQTNLEAATEIARQLRLRDLSGLVVVDFIDMEPRKAREQVQQQFRRELKRDRARTHTTDISSLGLMELSRQRIRTSLEANYSTECPHCNGSGKQRTVRSAALDIARLMRESSVQPDTAMVLVHAPLEVATYLLNEKRIEIRRMEDAYGVTIIILPDEKATGSNYKVTPLSKSRKRDAALLHKLSFEMDERRQNEKVEEYARNTPEEAPQARPLVKNVVPEGRPKTQEDHPEEKGILGKVIDMLFGSGTAKAPASPAPSRGGAEPGGGRKPDAKQGDAPSGGGRRRSRGGRSSSRKKQERREDAQKDAEEANRRQQADAKPKKGASENGGSRAQGRRGGKPRQEAQVAKQQQETQSPQQQRPTDARQPAKADPAPGEKESGSCAPSAPDAGKATADRPSAPEAKPPDDAQAKPDRHRSPQAPTQPDPKPQAPEIRIDAAPASSHSPKETPEPQRTPPAPPMSGAVQVETTRPPQE